MSESDYSRNRSYCQKIRNVTFFCQKISLCLCEETESDFYFLKQIQIDLANLCRKAVNTCKFLLYVSDGRRYIILQFICTFDSQ